MPDIRTNWAIVVHGGAKTIGPELQDRNREGCRVAAHAAAQLLKSGRGAIDAVEAAIKCLEDNPVFNAGYGSVLTSDHTVEMDASIMDGKTLAVGGVAGVSRLHNPVEVARAMLHERPVLLAGHGAERFAAEHGFALCSPKDMISDQALASEKAHDTVSCVALDSDGHVAAGTSTGGLPGKHIGRIGDSPLPACGLYADDTLGGVAFSGDGESIVRTILAARVMVALETSGASAAAQVAIDRLTRVGGEAGAIVIDRHGHIGVAHNSDHFAIAACSSRHPDNQAGVHRNELGELLDD